MKRYIPLLLIIAGCSSTGQMNSRMAYEQFLKYNVQDRQQRTYAPLKLKALDGQAISITGIAEIDFEAPLPDREILSAMPRSDTGLKMVESLGRHAVMGLLGWKAVDGLASQDTQVLTQPDPIIVEPTIIKP